MVIDILISIQVLGGIKRFTHIHSQECGQSERVTKITTMKGIYTLSKPTSSRDLVVVDVNAQPYGACASEVGWRMQLDPHYSVFLKPYISEKEFDDFSEQVNEAFSSTHNKGLPVVVRFIFAILSCPVIVLCMAMGEANLIGACEKSGRDKKTDKALASVDLVVQKWNERFQSNDVPLTMRLQCLRANANPIMTNMQAKPGMNRGADWRDLKENNDEIWIEFELGTIEKKEEEKPRSKKNSKTQKNHKNKKVDTTE